MRLRDRRRDLLFVVAFSVFAFTSLVMEIHPTFGIDLRHATDPFGRVLHFYASSFDPLFLDPPLYLRVMTGIDLFVFGPFYLVAIYALVKERKWIRLPGIAYVSAIVYSTVVYFSVEFLGERSRAELVWVTIINVPYVVVPLMFAWRLRAPTLFPTERAHRVEVNADRAEPGPLVDAAVRPGG
jgi:hypothetical protein